MPGPIIQKTSDSIWKFRSNSAIIGLRFYTHAKFPKVPIWDFGTLRMVLIQTVVFSVICRYSVEFDFCAKYSVRNLSSIRSMAIVFVRPVSSQ